MRPTITVRQLIERLQDEDPDAKVVFSSDYGDRVGTRQVHFLKGDFEQGKVGESAYSDSGFALADDDSDETDVEVLVLS